MAETSNTVTIIDENRREVTVSRNGLQQSFAIDSAEGFAAISQAWIKSGWEARYSYSFTWLGRPVIQLPEDLVRFQEILWSIQPDLLIETGVAHGGSLIFYASLFEAMGKGQVVGVDIHIRQENRAAIEAHRLARRIHLIEGSSIDAETVEKVKSFTASAEKVLVVLDSDHSKEHVTNELRLYSPMVSVGSFIVVTDGVMENLTTAPNGHEDWAWNNPRTAAIEFVAHQANFCLEEPAFLFNSGSINRRITYWPDAFLRRTS